jgi:hypothetical protein
MLKQFHFSLVIGPRNQEGEIKHKELAVSKKGIVHKVTPNVVLRMSINPEEKTTQAVWSVQLLGLYFKEEIVNISLLT